MARNRLFQTRKHQMSIAVSKFYVGQVVYHNLFDYRGVIVDVDPSYQKDGVWYDRMARTRPPKDRPWYQVLVHDSKSETRCSSF